MLEGYLTPFLQRILGRYIANLNTKDLKFGLFSSELALENLEFRLDVLNKEAKLPGLEFKTGTIAALKIAIPWTALTSQSIKVTVDKLEVSIGPADPATASSPASSAVTKSQSQQTPQVTNSGPETPVKSNTSHHSGPHVADAGSASSPTKPKPNEEGPGSASWQQLITKALLNVQVHFRFLTLRYVDRSGSATVLINSINLDPADLTWQPGYTDWIGSGRIFQHIASIAGISLFIHPPLSTPSTSTTKASDSPHSSEEKTFTDMGPPVISDLTISMRMKAFHRPSRRGGEPTRKVDLLIPSVPIKLSTTQLNIVQSILNNLKAAQSAAKKARAASKAAAAALSPISSPSTATDSTMEGSMPLDLSASSPPSSPRSRSSGTRSQAHSTGASPSADRRTSVDRTRLRSRRQMFRSASSALSSDSPLARGSPTTSPAVGISRKSVRTSSHSGAPGKSLQSLPFPFPQHSHKQDSQTQPKLSPTIPIIAHPSSSPLLSSTFLHFPPLSSTFPCLPGTSHRTCISQNTPPNTGTLRSSSRSVHDSASLPHPDDVASSRQPSSWGGWLMSYVVGDDLAEAAFEEAYSEDPSEATSMGFAARDTEDAASSQSVHALDFALTLWVGAVTLDLSPLPDPPKNAAPLIRIHLTALWAALEREDGLPAESYLGLQGIQVLYPKFHAQRPVLSIPLPAAVIHAPAPPPPPKTMKADDNSSSPPIPVPPSSSSTTPPSDSEDTPATSTSPTSPAQKASLDSLLLDGLALERQQIFQESLFGEQGLPSARYARLVTSIVNSRLKSQPGFDPTTTPPPLSWRPSRAPARAAFFQTHFPALWVARRFIDDEPFPLLHEAADVIVGDLQLTVVQEMLDDVAVVFAPLQNSNRAKPSSSKPSSSSKTPSGMPPRHPDSDTTSEQGTSDFADAIKRLWLDNVPLQLSCSLGSVTILFCPRLSASPPAGQSTVLPPGWDGRRLPELLTDKPAPCIALTIPSGLTVDNAKTFASLPLSHTPDPEGKDEGLWEISFPAPNAPPTAWMPFLYNSFSAHVPALTAGLVHISRDADEFYIDTEAAAITHMIPSWEPTSVSILAQTWLFPPSVIPSVAGASLGLSGLPAIHVSFVVPSITLWTSKPLLDVCSAIVDKKRTHALLPISTSHNRYTDLVLFSVQGVSAAYSAASGPGWTQSQFVLDIQEISLSFLQRSTPVNPEACPDCSARAPMDPRKPFLVLSAPAQQNLHRPIWSGRVPPDGQSLLQNNSTTTAYTPKLRARPKLSLLEPSMAQEPRAPEGAPRPVSPTTSSSEAALMIKADVARMWSIAMSDARQKAQERMDALAKAHTEQREQFTAALSRQAAQAVGPNGHPPQELLQAQTYQMQQLHLQQLEDVARLREAIGQEEQEAVRAREQELTTKLEAHARSERERAAEAASSSRIRHSKILYEALTSGRPATNPLPDRQAGQDDVLPPSWLQLQAVRRSGVLHIGLRASPAMVVLDPYVIDWMAETASVMDPRFPLQTYAEMYVYDARPDQALPSESSGYWSSSSSSSASRSRSRHRRRSSSSSSASSAYSSSSSSSSRSRKSSRSGSSASGSYSRSRSRSRRSRSRRRSSPSGSSDSSGSSSSSTRSISHTSSRRSGSSTSTSSYDDDHDGRDSRSLSQRSSDSSDILRPPRPRATVSVGPNGYNLPAERWDATTLSTGPRRLSEDRSSMGLTDIDDVAAAFGLRPGETPEVPPLHVESTPDVSSRATSMDRPTTISPTSRLDSAPAHKTTPALSKAFSTMATAILDVYIAPCVIVAPLDHAHSYALSPPLLEGRGTPIARPVMHSDETSRSALLSSLVLELPVIRVVTDSTSRLHTLTMEGARLAVASWADPRKEKLPTSDETDPSSRDELAPPPRTVNPFDVPSNAAERPSIWDVFGTGAPLNPALFPYCFVPLFIPSVVVKAKWDQEISLSLSVSILSIELAVEHFPLSVITSWVELVASLNSGSSESSKPAQAASARSKSKAKDGTRNVDTDDLSATPPALLRAVPLKSFTVNVDHVQLLIDFGVHKNDKGTEVFDDVLVDLQGFHIQAQATERNAGSGSMGIKSVRAVHRVNGSSPTASSRSRSGPMRVILSPLIPFGGVLLDWKEPALGASLTWSSSTAGQQPLAPAEVSPRAPTRTLSVTVGSLDVVAWNPVLKDALSLLTYPIRSLASGPVGGAVSSTTTGDDTNEEDQPGEVMLAETSPMVVQGDTVVMNEEDVIEDPSPVTREGAPEARSALQPEPPKSQLLDVERLKQDSKRASPVGGRRGPRRLYHSSRSTVQGPEQVLSMDPHAGDGGDPAYPSPLHFQRILCGAGAIHVDVGVLRVWVPAIRHSVDHALTTSSSAMVLSLCDGSASFGPGSEPSGGVWLESPSTKESPPDEPTAPSDSSPFKSMSSSGAPPLAVPPPLTLVVPPSAPQHHGAAFASVEAASATAAPEPPRVRWKRWSSSGSVSVEHVSFEWSPLDSDPAAKEPVRHLDSLLDGDPSRRHEVLVSPVNLSLHVLEQVVRYPGGAGRSVVSGGIKMDVSVSSAHVKITQDVWKTLHGIKVFNLAVKTESLPHHLIRRYGGGDGRGESRGGLGPSETRRSSGDASGARVRSVPKTRRPATINAVVDPIVIDLVQPSSPGNDSASAVGADEIVSLTLGPCIWDSKSWAPGSRGSSQLNARVIGLSIVDENGAQVVSLVEGSSPPAPLVSVSSSATGFSQVAPLGRAIIVQERLHVEVASISGSVDVRWLAKLLRWAEVPTFVAPSAFADSPAVTVGLIQSHGYLRARLDAPALGGFGATSTSKGQVYRTARSMKVMAGSWKISLRSMTAQGDDQGVVEMVELGADEVYIAAQTIPGGTRRGTKAGLGLETTGPDVPLDPGSAPVGAPPSRGPSLINAESPLGQTVAGHLSSVTDSSEDDAELTLGPGFVAGPVNVPASASSLVAVTGGSALQSTDVVVSGLWLRVGVEDRWSSLALHPTSARCVLAPQKFVEYPEGTHEGEPPSVGVSSVTQVELTSVSIDASLGHLELLLRVLNGPSSAMSSLQRSLNPPLPLLSHSRVHLQENELQGMFEGRDSDKALVRGRRPRPGEVTFSRDLSGDDSVSEQRSEKITGPGSDLDQEIWMAWCYPTWRAVREVHVSPINMSKHSLPPRVRAGPLTTPTPVFDANGERGSAATDPVRLVNGGMDGMEADAELRVWDELTGSWVTLAKFSIWNRRWGRWRLRSAPPGRVWSIAVKKLPGRAPPFPAEELGWCVRLVSAHTPYYIPTASAGYTVAGLRLTVLDDFPAEKGLVSVPVAWLNMSKLDVRSVGWSDGGAQSVVALSGASLGYVDYATGREVSIIDPTSLRISSASIAARKAWIGPSLDKAINAALRDRIPAVNDPAAERNPDPDFGVNFLYPKTGGRVTALGRDAAQKWLEYMMDDPAGVSVCVTPRAVFALDMLGLRLGRSAAARRSDLRETGTGQVKRVSQLPPPIPYASVIVSNYTGMEICFGQGGTREVEVLGSRESVSYLWRDGRDSADRALVFSVSPSGSSPINDVASGLNGRRRWSDPVVISGARHGDLARTASSTRTQRVSFGPGQPMLWVEVARPAGRTQTRVRVLPGHRVVNALSEEIEVRVETGMGQPDWRSQLSPWSGKSGKEFISDPTEGIGSWLGSESVMKLSVRRVAGHGVEWAWSEMLSVGLDDDHAKLVELREEGLGGQRGRWVWLRVVSGRSGCVVWIEPPVRLVNAGAVPVDAVLRSNSEAAMAMPGCEWEIAPGQSIPVTAIPPGSPGRLFFRLKNAEGGVGQWSAPGIPVDAKVILEGSDEPVVRHMPVNGASIESGSLLVLSTTVTAVPGPAARSEVRIGSPLVFENSTRLPLSVQVSGHAGLVELDPGTKTMYPWSPAASRGAASANVSAMTMLERARAEFCFGAPLGSDRVKHVWSPWLSVRRPEDEVEGNKSSGEDVQRRRRSSSGAAVRGGRTSRQGSSTSLTSVSSGPSPTVSSRATPAVWRRSSDETAVQASVEAALKRAEEEGSVEENPQTLVENLIEDELDLVRLDIVGNKKEKAGEPRSVHQVEVSGRGGARFYTVAVFESESGSVRVVIAPLFRLYNLTGWVLEVSAAGHGNAQVLSPAGWKGESWMGEENEGGVGVGVVEFPPSRRSGVGVKPQVVLRQGDLAWSGALTLSATVGKKKDKDSAGTRQRVWVNLHGDRQVMLTVSTLVHDGSVSLVLWHDPFPPFLIDNRTDLRLQVRNSEGGERGMVGVSPRQLIEWDWPSDEDEGPEDEKSSGKKGLRLCLDAPNGLVSEVIDITTAGEAIVKLREAPRRHEGQVDGGDGVDGGKAKASAQGGGAVGESGLFSWLGIGRKSGEGTRAMSREVGEVRAHVVVRVFLYGGMFVVRLEEGDELGRPTTRVEKEWITGKVPGMYPMGGAGLNELMERLCEPEGSILNRALHLRRRLTWGTLGTSVKVFGLRSGSVYLFDAHEKDFAHLVVSGAMLTTMESMDVDPWSLGRSTKTIQGYVAGVIMDDQTPETLFPVVGASLGPAPTLSAKGTTALVLGGLVRAEDSDAVHDACTHPWLDAHVVMSSMSEPWYALAGARGWEDRDEARGGRGGKPLVYVRYARLGLGKAEVSLGEHFVERFTGLGGVLGPVLSGAGKKDAKGAAESLEGKDERVVVKTWGALSQGAVSRATAQLICIQRLELSSLELQVTVRANVRVFVGVDKTPLKFSAVTLTGLAVPPKFLVQELSARYILDAIVSAPALLGSLDMLGNPLGFLRKVSTGVYDLVSMPLMGARSDGAGGFFRGVGMGTTSLLSNLTGGTLQSVSGITSNLARNLRSLDDGSQSGARRPAHVGSGLAQGFQGLGAGVLGGAVGVVSEPIAGASQRGFRGLLGGLGRGLLGAVTKPVSGALELVSAASDGALASIRMGSWVAEGGRRTRGRDEPESRGGDLGVRWLVLRLLDYGDFVALAHVKVRVFRPDQVMARDGAEEDALVVLTSDSVYEVRDNFAVGVWSLKGLVGAEGSLRDGRELILSGPGMGEVGAARGGEAIGSVTYRFLSRSARVGWLEHLRRLRRALDQVA